MRVHQRRINTAQQLAPYGNKLFQLEQMLNDPNFQFVTGRFSGAAKRAFSKNWFGT